MGISTLSIRPKAVTAALESVELSSNVAPEMCQALVSDTAVFQPRRRNRRDLAEQWMASLPITSHDGRLVSVAPEITRLAIKRTPASVDCGETPD